jgi:hypothetical protein
MRRKLIGEGSSLSQEPGIQGRLRGCCASRRRFYKFYSKEAWRRMFQSHFVFEFIQGLANLKRIGCENKEQEWRSLQQEALSG